MGTRRGGDRREESNAFEAANPFLKRVETTLEVERSDEPFIEECVALEDHEGDEPGVPAPAVKQDGVPVDFFTNGFEPVSPDLSFVEVIFTPIGELEASNGGDDEDISMSEYGFGVFSGEDDESEDEDDMGAYALNGDEYLDFDIRNYDDRKEIDGPGSETGGVSFEIEYVVLSGSGQVGIELSDFSEKKEKDGPGSVEAMSGFLSAGDTGRLEATAMDGAFFDEAIVYVDGSIQVGILGISVITNFEGSLLDG